MQYKRKHRLSAALMAGAADADKTDTTKITPRNDVADLSLIHI